MGKRQENKPKGLKKVLLAKGVGGLVLRIVIMLVIPYAYLMLCGLVFDRLLRWYFMTTFIFFSLIVLYIVAIVFCVLAIVWFAKARKQKA